MLAYAASRPQVGRRQSNPHAMLLVISAHIALIAVVVSAKMDLPQRIHDRIIRVTLIRDPVPPPAHPTPQTHTHPSTQLPIGDSRPALPTSHPEQVLVDAGIGVDTGPVAGAGTVVVPQIPFDLIPFPVRHDARLLTPPSELRPPYPAAKILSEEEATLRLKLTISDSGRVIAVDPVGAADREFLDAARRYLLAHWRYQPATEDGRAVASSTVITLRFQLDG
jgi:protein TonB